MARVRDFQGDYGPWALVTGASSGIGEALARELAARGVSVAIVARRKERLAELAAGLRRDHGVGAVELAIDLSDEIAIDELDARTRDLPIGLVAANAGFGDKGPFLTADRAQLARMIDLNCRATALLCHAFAPRLLARGRGGLLITSSTAAFQGTPRTAVYAATKAFDLLLAEALHFELAPHGVDVVALCPGGTDTEGPARTGVDPAKVPLGLMNPRDVARDGLDALGRRAIVVPGAHNRLSVLATRALPRGVASQLAGRMIRRVTGE
ncbi:MAG: SDR family oxidoreductase [Polyangiaceae bacterium]|nr:SDR family oxidoreductase [Polyangiaceae bacterium]